MSKRLATATVHSGYYTVHEHQVWDLYMHVHCARLSVYSTVTFVCRKVSAIIALVCVELIHNSKPEWSVRIPSGEKPRSVLLCFENSVGRGCNIDKNNKNTSIGGSYDMCVWLLRTFEVWETLNSRRRLLLWFSRHTDVRTQSCFVPPDVLLPRIINL